MLRPPGRSMPRAERVGIQGGGWGGIQRAGGGYPGGEYGGLTMSRTLK